MCQPFWSSVISLSLCLAIQRSIWLSVCKIFCNFNFFSRTTLASSKLNMIAWSILWWRGFKFAQRKGHTQCKKILNLIKLWIFDGNLWIFAVDQMLIWYKVCLLVCLRKCCSCEWCGLCISCLEFKGLLPLSKYPNDNWILMQKLNFFYMYKNVSV